MQWFVRGGRCRRGANVGQDASRFDRGQLIAVPEQDESRLRRHRRDQFRHQREIDHRRFIDDHDIELNGFSALCRK